jgi:hypothetical protein
MTNYKHAGSVFAGAAIAGAALFVIANAVAALVGRELGEVAAFFTVQVALAAALFAPFVVKELGERETLSVYRAMREQH